VLLALLGATAGQGVVWYTGQFYALFFLTITLKVDLLLAYAIVGLSLLLGTAFFVFLGWLSDKIGRLKVILAGCLIAAITYIPLFSLLTSSVNPDLAAFQDKHKVTLTTDNTTFNFHVFVVHGRNSATVIGQRISSLSERRSTSLEASAPHRMIHGASAMLTALAVDPQP
jgi:MFS family permease